MMAQTPYPSLQTTKYMNTISKSIWTQFLKKKKKKKKKKKSYMSTTFFTNRIIKKKKITTVNIINYD